MSESQVELTIPVALRRITEVWSNRADGSFGSGYLLGGGLILTARHVVMPEGSKPPTVIKARPLGIAHRVTGLQAADLVWPDLAQLADPAPDAALLRLRDFVDADDVGPRLGPPDDDVEGHGTPVTATGFPAFVPCVGMRRETEQIAGVIFLATALVAGRYEIKDMTVRDREKLNQELDWHGMSGAALLTHGRVIGILITRKSAGQRYDFSAVRIETLLAISEFRTAIRGHVKLEDVRPPLSMPTAPTKPVIFISYAHADERDHSAAWLSWVRDFLEPGVKEGAFEVWTDVLIRGGEDWNAEIERKLRTCDIFVMLVSRYSTSSYVTEKEIAIIRERQARDKNVYFYPLLLTPTPRVGLKKILDKNLRPRDATPLLKFSRYKREKEMCEIANELEEVARNIDLQKNASDFQYSRTSNGNRLDKVSDRKLILSDE